ncbi:amino acid ABC transporter permease [Brucella pseudogrignonensis]|uniref:amino acid ABC transporter permease n=1 Tax=Brucella pseudogrignonensis TaxID=419475 RepID=UPI0007DA5C32|nr:amino acid ABC transporter permease [Brucella pseudogrignonensis]ANG98728.1 amino acid ABC transporter permease [Brucella pseudogrignonensis]
MNSLFEAWFGFLPDLISGLSLTIIISVGAIALATVFGLLLESLRWSEIPLLMHINAVLVVVLRGVPTLVFIYYVYFVLPTIGVDLSPLTAGILALAISHAPYMAENIRLSIESLDKGQFEAATAMGMSKSLTMRRVILPQAIKSLLPPYGNSIVMAIKDSSLCAVITVAEITRQAQIIAAETFRTLEAFSQAALLYFIMCAPLILLIRFFEGRIARKV